MLYQMLPNILFIFAILGILLIILRHLPEAISDQKAEEEIPIEEKLGRKGLPAVAISRAAGVIKLSATKMWNFLLEAKDVRPSAVAGYKIKKLFSHKAKPAPQTTAIAQQLDDIRDEKFYLGLIRKDPKNLELYENLGQYYLDTENYSDAKDIYQYLSSHEPTNAEYSSRLGYSYFKLAQFPKAIEFYKKAISLDSTQPNRYYNLGRSLENLEDLDGALDAFEQALNLEPGNGKYYISLSNVQLKQGNRNDAKVTLRTARKIDPSNEAVAEKLKNF